MRTSFRRAITTRLAASAVALLVLLTAGAAHAEDVKSTEFELSFDESLISPTYDSGLVPANSPLQVQLVAQFRDRFDIDMPGTATVDWSTNELSIEGAPGDGRLSYSLGGEVEVNINLTLTQLPIGPFALDIPATESFEPFLLEGATDRPVETSTTLTFTIADEDFTIGNSMGNFKLDVEADIVGISFQGEKITFAAGYDEDMDVLVDELGTMTQDGEVLTLDGIVPPAAPETVSVWAQFEGTLSSEVELRLIPQFSAGVFGPITLTLDVPIDVVEDETVVFAPVEIPLEGPDPEPEPEPEPEPDPEPMPDLHMEEGETGDFGTNGPGDDGCGCDAARGSSPGGAALTGLALVGLLGLRRRRSR